MSSRAFRTVVVWGWVSQFVLLTAGSAWWHDHGPSGRSHLHLGTCGSAAADDSDTATCCHGHRHAADRTAADSGRAPDSDRATHGPQVARGFAAHDCAVCRFLAQPQPLAGPSQSTVQIALDGHEPTVEPQGPARAALDVPAARGPPGTLAG